VTAVGVLVGSVLATEVEVAEANTDLGAVEGAVLVSVLGVRFKMEADFSGVTSGSAST